MFRSCLIFVFLSLSSFLLPSFSSAQLIATPKNIVCYQEVVATHGSYTQIDTSLKTWSQKMYNTLNLTGPIELSVGWARVPDRTGFENNCTGPYPNIADLFVHIQTNTVSYDSISSALESFIASNRMTSQPNIVCSARSIITYLPGCGKITGGAGLNNGTTNPPTNQTGTSNSTIAPTLVPSTGGGAIPSNTTTVAPINSTTIESSSTGISSNSTSNESSSTGISSNSTSTGISSNSTTNESSSSSISSNSTSNSTLPTGSGSAIPSSTSISTNTTSTSISSNSTSGGNSTSTNSTENVVGGAATQDGATTGGVSFNTAYTTTMTIGTMGFVLIPSIMNVLML